MKIVLDCANGSASAIAPEVFGGLGFTIVATEAEPDGRNINEECGALHPEKLAQTVLARKPTWGSPSTATLTGPSGSIIAAGSSAAITRCSSSAGR